MYFKTETDKRDIGKLTNFLLQYQQIVRQSLIIIERLSLTLRQTAKIKLLPSVFSSLYSRIKILVFAVNSKRHFNFCMIYLTIIL